MMALNFIAVVSLEAIGANTLAFLKLSVLTFSHVLALWAKVIAMAFATTVFVLALKGNFECG
jgi:hypothetical protein